MARVFTFEDGKQMCFDKTIYANGEYVLFKDYSLLDEERRAGRDQLERANIQMDDLKEQSKKLEKTRGDLDDNAIVWREKYEKAEKEIKELESELEVKDNLLKIKNGLLGNNDELPTDPMEVTQMLINSTYEYELSDLEKAFFKCGDTRTTERYSIDDLEQIAEHLLVYCKHNREDEE